jgi:hypothetical protein
MPAEYSPEALLLGTVVLSRAQAAVHLYKALFLRHKG